MTRRVAVVSVSRADRAMAAVVARALMAEGIETIAIAVDDPSGPDEVLENHGVRVHRLAADVAHDGGAENVWAARRMGRLTAAFADAFSATAPDIVVLTGDRYETLGAAGAAVLYGAVIAHLHGGEVTEGALDDGFRHAISKLAHLHFPATDAAAARLRRLGEEDWRITVAGAPGLDLLRDAEPMTRAAFFDALGIDDPGAFVLATWHPETLSDDDGEAGLGALLAGLDALSVPVVFTGVNADPGGARQAARIAQWAESRPHVHLKASLGGLYAAALSHAALMAGNSSSGIIEAASFALPVVDVGERQKGRDRGANVIQAVPEAKAIGAALRRALDPGFRAGLAGMANPYGDGGAGPRIARRLASAPLDQALRRKRFPNGEDAR